MHIMAPLHTPPINNYRTIPTVIDISTPHSTHLNAMSSPMTTPPPQEAAPKPLLALDLYGTLLDTSSISTALESHLPSYHKHLATQICQDWRKHQLEYTWRLNSMGKYDDFSTVTKLSLTDALHRAGAHLPSSTHKLLLSAYDSLSAFADVPQLLHSLQELQIPAVIFSNGTPTQLASAVAMSPVLKDSCIARAQTPFISVHDVGRFKPAPETYRYLLRRLGVEEADAERVVMVSSNPFDVVGAAAVGLRTIWVDREGKGWGDGLGRPKHVVRSLEEVVEIVDDGGDECF